MERVDKVGVGSIDSVKRIDILDRVDKIRVDRVNLFVWEKGAD